MNEYNELTTELDLIENSSDHSSRVKRYGWPIGICICILIVVLVDITTDKSDNWQHIRFLPTWR